MRHSRGGFIFLLLLIVFPIMVGLATTGMLRSVHSILVITRVLTTLQELHAAEGGIDDALKQLAPLTPTHINQLLSQPPARTLACALPDCTITVQDNITGGTQDTDGLLLVTTTATANGITQTIRTTIEVPRPAPNAFDFVAAGSSISLSGNASIGDALRPPADRGVLYVGGEPGPTGSFGTTNSNGGGPSFASGFAIIGAPGINLAMNSTIDITGFVMTHGTHDNLKADGAIRGGLMGVTDPTGVNVGNGPGPGTPTLPPTHLTGSRSPEGPIWSSTHCPEPLRAFKATPEAV